MYGQYQVVERIAVGGMAEIYRGIASGTEGFERSVVIKKVHPRYSKDHRFVQMLINEAKITARLNHANIVQILDLCRSTDDEYFIVMEYVDGRDLRALMEMAITREQPLELDTILYIASEVCDALTHAHSLTDANGRPLSLIHRDVSPSNVLVSYSGEVKLTDFGVARFGRDVSVIGSLKGKLAYMSPEQARAERVDHRSDIFSLGAVLFEMILGRRIFMGRTDDEMLHAVRLGAIPHPSAVDPETPAELERILLRALAPKVERYQSAAAFGAALRSFRFSHCHARVGSTELAALLERLFERGEARRKDPADPFDEAGFTIHTIVDTKHDGPPSSANEWAFSAQFDDVTSETVLTEQEMLEQSIGGPTLRELRWPALDDTPVPAGDVAADDDPLGDDDSFPTVEVAHRLAPPATSDEGDYRTQEVEIPPGLGTDTVDEPVPAGLIGDLAREALQRTARDDGPRTDPQIRIDRLGDKAARSSPGAAVARRLRPGRGGAAAPTTPAAPAAPPRREPPAAPGAGPTEDEDPERTPVVDEDLQRASLADEDPERTPVVDEDLQRAPLADEGPERTPIAAADGEPPRVAGDDGETTQVEGGDDETTQVAAADGEATQVRDTDDETTQVRDADDETTQVRDADDKRAGPRPAMPDAASVLRQALDAARTLDRRPPSGGAVGAPGAPPLPPRPQSVRITRRGLPGAGAWKSGDQIQNSESEVKAFGSGAPDHTEPHDPLLQTQQEAVHEVEPEGVESVRPATPFRASRVRPAIGGPSGAKRVRPDATGPVQRPQPQRARPDATGPRAPESAATKAEASSPADLPRAPLGGDGSDLLDEVFSPALMAAGSSPSDDAATLISAGAASTPGGPRVPGPQLPLEAVPQPFAQLAAPAVAPTIAPRPRRRLVPLLVIAPLGLAIGIGASYLIVTQSKTEHVTGGMAPTNPPIVHASTLDDAGPRASAATDKDAGPAAEPPLATAASPDAAPAPDARTLARATPPTRVKATAKPRPKATTRPRTIARRSKPARRASRRVPPRSKPRRTKLASRSPRPAKVSTPTTQARGEVVIKSEPWAYIYVDGRKTKHTTSAKPISLPAGRRRIKLVNPVLKLDRSLTIDVEAGAVVRRFVTLGK